MKKILWVLMLLLQFLFTLKPCCVQAREEGSQYVFLNELEIYILLKKQPCSLTENQLIALKTKLLALRNNTPIKRYKKIGTLEQLNAIYGYSISLERLPTCTMESLERSNLEFDEPEDSEPWWKFW